MFINKKSIVVFVVVNICSLYAQSEKSLILRGGGFIPTSDLVRCIYGKGMGDVQLEFAARCREACWGIWANLAFAPKEGCSLGLQKATKIQLLNLSLGFRYLFEYDDCFTAAIGFGPNIGHVRLNNCTTCSCPEVSETGIGFVVKGDLYYKLSDCWFLDFFADYTFQRIDFTSRADVSGVTLGLGIGRNF